jgi:hypothetical protein
MVRFAADAITSFSATPLRLATYLGLAAAALGLLLLAYTLCRWLNGSRWLVEHHDINRDLRCYTTCRAGHYG